MKQNGHIEFVTFHQSMSYEDFVEGIKPQTIDNKHITYNIEPGIFKQICIKAKNRNYSSFDTAYNSFINEIIEKHDNFFKLETPRKNKFAVSVNRNNNLTLHTGNDLKPQGTFTKENLLSEFNGTKAFFGWEGYSLGIINHLTSNYRIQRGIEGQSQNYVLIIDEINRGNIANIFGELITLIESEKRAGMSEEISIKLPYTKDKEPDFSVPSNLYIIGTMNTADRSVEALDTALRRRFTFIEKVPQPDLLPEETDFGVNLCLLLKTINNRISVLLDKDHCIGHSYFMKCKTENNLKSIFQYKIFPLLQEYFYNDFSKIRLILGNDFVKEDNSQVKFAERPDFELSVRYQIQDVSRISNLIESVNKIYHATV